MSVHKIKKMRVSKFEFSSWDDCENAANEIYSNCGGYDAYDKDGYYLYILSTCTDVDLAMKICRGNDGKRIAI